MAKKARKFVAKADNNGLWRIWDKKAKKWWGEYYTTRPDELNGEKRPEVINSLLRVIQLARNNRPT
ncbi:MAG: hypothetical protein CR974_03820 [Gammaproteobacteria bacterium]|nr:MAG: hypothetical protein CR974_03820 [Gammaproteobacteria bacterium]